MVTDQQVRRLFKMVKTESSIEIASMKAGMDAKTARKYHKQGKLPSELKQEHVWQTRKDPFADVWESIKSMLEINPGLEAKTLFDDLQRKHPGRYSDGQLRTLQRRIKRWKAEDGPAKEIFFDQIHKPGELCQSDYTNMNKLGITIGGVPFDHLMYHFVLTYSNWETGIICFSESFESLSHGLQSALWELCGVPLQHRTDCLTAAVNKACNPEEFTRRYQDLVDHYGILPCKTNPRSPHENGDVEQRNYRFKNAVDQSLLLRGNRNFENKIEYEVFLQQLFIQLNAGRKQRLMEERAVLSKLPDRRIDSCKKQELKVGPSSTIRVNHNVYSVNSKLIGETVQIRLYMEHLEIWYGQKKLDTIPRQRGKGNYRINYRHIIDSLIRKPGAFENYRYHEALFPTSWFRIAYDKLKNRYTLRSAAKRYLSILYIAAKESESSVNNALEIIINKNMDICKEQVKTIMNSDESVSEITDIYIPEINLSNYDQLLEGVTSC